MHASELSLRQHTNIQHLEHGRIGGYVNMLYTWARQCIAASHDDSKLVKSSFARRMASQIPLKSKSRRPIMAQDAFSAPARVTDAEAYQRYTLKKEAQ